MDIFPYMGTQCLNINRTSCIVGTVSAKEVTLLKSGYIYAGLLRERERYRERDREREQTK